MIRWLSHLHARRTTGERGAAYIEFTIVMPLLVILLFGMLEFGLAFRNRSVALNSMRAATRTAASVGDARLADYSILRTLGAGLADLEGGSIRRVVVFDASDPDGIVPSACLTPSALADGGVDDLCNVYPGSMLTSLNQSDFVDPDCTGSADTKWCPLTRNDSIDSADYVGVWVEVEIGWITSVLPGDGLDLTDTAVARIEPRS